MHLLQAIIMGLVQGLTEFLPVSSSAHLVFAGHFLHLRLNEGDTVSFDVLLHLGTLVAVLVYFRRDVWLLLHGAGQLLVRPRSAWRENLYSRLFVWLALGTIPAAIAGVVLKKQFEAAFMNVPGTAALLLVTAAMLFYVSGSDGKRDLGRLGFWDVIVVGICQAVAILPGISRSGATITGGLLRGLDRETAPRFSFLLSMPIILAGGLFSMKDALHGGFHLSHTVIAAGFLAAAVSGYFAVALLLRMVTRGRLHLFGYYCALAGLTMLFYWTFLVPKVNTGIGGLVGERTVYMNSDSELGPMEIGEAVQLHMIVDPGLVTLTDAYALVPVGYGHPAQRLNFSFDGGVAVKGKWGFTSEKYTIRPFMPGISTNAGAETREVWVILRNKWGIRNEVRLRLLIEPESVLRRTA